MSLMLLGFLLLGTGVMMIPIMIQGNWYHFDVKKRIVVTVLLTIIGTISTYIWFFIENHWIGGISFYGAVFLVPLVFFYIARLLNEKWQYVLDLCAPAECAMLAIMKIQCLVHGCCKGMILNTSAEGIVIRFPSPIAEMVNGLLLLIILLALARKERYRTQIYPIYMLLYGITRFILNFFREEQQPFFGGLTAGSFWSILAIVIAGIWLNRLKCKK